MANREPAYIVKWIGTIAASVITAYLITNYVTNNKSDKSPDIDAGRGVLPFEQEYGLFKFQYPVFMDKVVESVSSDKPIVAVSVVRTGLLEIKHNVGEKSWEDLSLFEKLTIDSGSMDLDEMGMVTVTLVPTYYLLAEISTKKTGSKSASVETDIFAGLGPRSRVQVDWGNLPSSGCTQRSTEDAVNLNYLYAGHGVSLIVDGRFSKEAWSTHRSEIHRMFSSFSVDEAASVRWFRSHLEDGSVKYEDSEKLSEVLASIPDQQLPAHHKEEKAPVCIETL